MAISLHTAGTWNRLVTNGTVSIPSAVSAGDRLFLFASWKDYAITVTNPTGWTPVGSEFADGTTNAGNGLGSVKVMAWYRDWQSGDADPTITWSSAPTEGHAVIMVWSKGAGETWTTPLTATAAWPSSASQTISASGTTVVPDGSVVMGLLGIRDDSTGFTRGATTGIDVASGITWNGNYVESPSTHFTSTTGLDMSGDLGHRLVTTGGTVTLRMTATIDAAETGAAKWVVQGVTTGTTVTPGTAALTVTTFVPTVSVSDNKSATPGTAALTVTGFAPTVTVSDHKTVTPGTVELTITTFAPTVVVSDNKSVTPGTAELVTETFAPTVAVSDNKFVEPGPAELITETFAPTVAITENQFVEPGTASLTITTFAPIVTVEPAEAPPEPSAAPALNRGLTGGLGAYFWRHPVHGLQKCSERTSDACDPTETDNCCAVIACSYCLEWDVYGNDLVYGYAGFSTSAWSGSVAGVSFLGYWERNPETLECEFIVKLDGIEVYRKSCYEGQSCRDSSDEVETVIDYDEGTLRWRRYEPLPLPHITDPDTGCSTWFCGDCECSCECLCVIVTDTENIEIARGEICNMSYPCDPPSWEGYVGYYDLRLVLGRDEYGNCIITPTVDGIEQEAVAAAGCKDMSAVIVLDDGTTISVVCKVCDCEQELSPCCGCPSFGGNVGCIVYDSHDECISADRFDLGWSAGRGGMPSSPTTWGTVTCEMHAIINMGASIPGCEAADIDWTFVIFQVRDPDVSVSHLISDCEWAMEVYADGVYYTVYFEYSSECQVNGLDNPLGWIQFPNVDIGGFGIATVTADFQIPATKC